MKKGAIFDMDGLLFDTESIYQKAWLKLAVEFGVEPNPELGPAVCGSSGESMRRIVSSFYPQIDVDAYNQRVREYVHEQIRTNPLRIMDGVREILDFFAEQKIKMAVASSSSREMIVSNLQRAGLTDYFEAVVSGAELKHGKPAPDIFLVAAEEIGYAPEDCYVFEDGMNGIRAAYAAGCTAIMIPDLVKPTEEVQKMCSGIFSSLTEARQAIIDGNV